MSMDTQSQTDKHDGTPAEKIVAEFLNDSWTYGREASPYEIGRLERVASLMQEQDSEWTRWNIQCTLENCRITQKLEGFPLDGWPNLWGFYFTMATLCGPIECEDILIAPGADGCGEGIVLIGPPRSGKSSAMAVWAYCVQKWQDCTCKTVSALELCHQLEAIGRNSKAIDQYLCSFILGDFPSLTEEEIDKHPAVDVLILEDLHTVEPSKSVLRQLVRMVEMARKAGQSVCATSVLDKEDLAKTLRSRRDCGMLADIFLRRLAERNTVIDFGYQPTPEELKNPPKWYTDMDKLFREEIPEARRLLKEAEGR